MDINTAIARALSGVGKGTRYESPGRMPSFDGSAWPTNARCDCSGFVDWCLRLFPARRVDHPLYRRVNGGWFETTAIHADGHHSTGFFTRLSEARPGALLVYPDHRGSEGHVGLVLEAAGPGVQGVTRVVHCSLGNWRSKKDAIQVTEPDAWINNEESIIVWLDDLVETH